MAEAELCCAKNSGFLGLSLIISDPHGVLLTELRQNWARKSVRMIVKDEQKLTDHIKAEIESESDGINRAAGLYPPSSVKKNFGWIIAGNIATELSLGGVLVGLAKLGSAQMQGRFLLCLGIVFPIAIFLSLGLRGLLITDSKEEFAFSDYLYVRAVTSIVTFALCISVGVGLVFHGNYGWDLFCSAKHGWCV